MTYTTLAIVVLTQFSCSKKDPLRLKVPNLETGLSKKRVHLEKFLLKKETFQISKLSAVSPRGLNDE